MHRSMTQLEFELAPKAGPETSTVLEDILGRWGELWLPVRERTLRAVIQEKDLLFLCFDLLYRFFWIFFLPTACSCSCRFYWHYEIWLTFRDFFSSVTFFMAVINLCIYVWLLQFCRVFLSLSLFLFNFNYLNLLFFPHLFSCLLFLVFFPPCS